LGEQGQQAATNIASTLESIEQALNRHGVIPFSTPTPGVRALVNLTSLQFAAEGQIAAVNL
jgi:hypothetical protein